jgi:hypothetical protein
VAEDLPVEISEDGRVPRGILGATEEAGCDCGVCGDPVEKNCYRSGLVCGIVVVRDELFR